MNPFSFFKKSKKEYLVLDFGQSSVKGLIFAKNQKKVIIKQFASQAIERYGVFGRREDFELEIVRKAGQKILERLGIKNRQSDFEAIIGLSPEILKARVVVVSLERRKPSEKIGKGEKVQIYKNVFEKAKQKYFQEIQGKEDLILEDIKVLRWKVLEEKIAGYKVPSLLGFRGRDLDFKILLLFYLRHHLKFIKKLLTVLKLKAPQISHEVEGLMNCEQLKKSGRSHLFLDVGADATQVFSFAKELQFIDEFKVGGSAFQRAISKALGVREEEAEVLKKRYSEKQLTVPAEKRLREIISPVISLWQETFEKSLGEKVTTFDFFPQEVLLFGGGCLLPGIKEVLQQRETLEPKPFGSKVARILELQDLPLQNQTGKELSAEAMPAILLGLAYR